MSRSRSISVSSDRLEHLLAYALALFILIGLYAATLGALRLAISLGWYVS
jgi:hypothetical protein